MDTETTTGSGTAPEGQPTKSKSAKNTSKKAGSAKSKARTSKKIVGAKRTKTAKAPKSERVTKTAVVLELLRRKEGATIVEIAEATGWQNHSIRGFLSGTVTKKMALALESSKNEAGERTYRIG